MRVSPTKPLSASRTGEFGADLWEFVSWGGGLAGHRCSSGSRKGLTFCRTARARTLGLCLGRIHVDVLLARQLHELVHDLVGHRTENETIGLHPLVSRKVERLTDSDADPANLGHDLAGGLDAARVDHRNRQHAYVTFECHACDTGLAAVQPTVRRASSLWVDAQQLVFTQDAQTSENCRLASPPAGAVNRQLSQAREEPRGEASLDALTGEVVALGQERDVPVDHQRQEDG